MTISPWTFREKYHKFCDVSTTVNQGDIPFIIWLFENPKSWFHLNGACDLKKHDMIHVLLECDQSNADEAFVIGFTMGNDKNIKPWEVKLFKFISSRLYPKKNRFTKGELEIFDDAFDYGKSRNYNEIANYNWSEKEMNSLFKDIQKKFEIFPNELEYYKCKYNEYKEQCNENN